MGFGRGAASEIIHRSIHRSIDPSIHPSIHRSIDPSIHPLHTQSHQRFTAYPSTRHTPSNNRNQGRSQELFVECTPLGHHGSIDQSTHRGWERNKGEQQQNHPIKRLIYSRTTLLSIKTLSLSLLFFLGSFFLLASILDWSTRLIHPSSYHFPIRRRGRAWAFQDAPSS